MIAAQQIARLFGGFRGRVALCAAALALLACAPSRAPAQAPTWTELPQFKDPPEYSKKKSEVLSTGTADDATKKLFDEHYTFRIAEMTLRGSYDKLAAKRDDLKKKDLVPLGRAPSSELHDRLTEFLATRLPRLCADSQYHPAVRQNWTLILGDLNSKEPAFNGQGEVPLTAVLPELQKLYVDENQHVAVRLAALVGIKRHVKANATADVRKQLAKAMTAIVANKQPPKGTDQKTYDFFRLRTIDALRTILDSAPDAGDETAAAALAELTADAKVKLYYRCEAAAAIGQLESRSIEKEDVPQLARLFGELAVEVTKREAPPAAAPPPPGPGQPMQPRDAAEPMPKDPADAKQPADAAKTPPPAGAPPAVPMPDAAPKAAPDAHGGADGGTSWPKASRSRSRPREIGPVARSTSLLPRLRATGV